jgi:S-adenosylmethionine:tRNA ribosyltransferase-isomerase
VDEVEGHIMHSERYLVPDATVRAIADARVRGGRITAIGTTSLRALEAAAQSGKLKSGDGETRLFIRPGYGFKLVDRLLTNFHLPRSTLLILVSAFAGIEHIRDAYQHAVNEGYRFFSYGDAMLIDRAGAKLRAAA